MGDYFSIRFRLNLEDYDQSSDCRQSEPRETFELHLLPLAYFCSIGADKCSARYS